MRHTKSYMVPKLVCLNVLALMMFSFEHTTTANDQPLMKTAKVKQPAPADQVALMQTSVTASAAEPQQAITVDSPMAVKKTAAYKKPTQHHARLKTQSMLIKATYTANSAVDCCFRGNRT